LLLLFSLASSEKVLEECFDWILGSSGIFVSKREGTLINACCLMTTLNSCCLCLRDIPLQTVCFARDRQLIHAHGHLDSYSH